MLRQKNVEVKARLRDLSEAEELLASLGATKLKVLHQTDYYFEVPRGRLKLRDTMGSDEVELIYYERADEPGPRLCDATIIKLARADAEPLKQILPIKVVVRKRRAIYELEGVEVHLDDVEGLGPFIELEIRTGPSLSEGEAIELAKRLLAKLGVRDEDLVPYSYSDLLANKRGSMGAGGISVLWAPWRMSYVVKAHEARGCLFCELKGARDEEGKVVFRSRTCYVVLNIYPYNTGHVMVAPYRHVACLSELTDEELLDLWRTVGLAIKAIKEAYRPHGFNVGMNLGRVAGAGVEDHLHIHIVPRWLGDTNFMPVIASTKVISQHIDETYTMLKEAFEKVSKAQAKLEAKCP